MVPTYSLRIFFNNSRSKNFIQAIKLACFFNDFQRGEINVVNISMKEIFEKWEYFNLLFWRSVDWAGTALEWEGMAFYSHSDKTRIFYALQQAHVSYICFLESKISRLGKVYTGEWKYEDLDHVYSESDMNMLLDTFQIIKQNHDILKDESFKNIIVKPRPW